MIKGKNLGVERVNIDMTAKELIEKATHPVEVKESDYFRYVKIDLNSLLKDFIRDYMCSGDMVEEEFSKIFTMYVQKQISMDMNVYGVARQIHMYLEALEKEGGVFRECD